MYVETINSDAMAAARRGAAFLDTRYRTWRRQINLPRLNMDAGVYNPDVLGSCGCVLAQIDYAFGRDDEGHFDDRAERLGISGGREQQDLGFYAGDDYSWLDLTRAWWRVLLDP